MLAYCALTIDFDAILSDSCAHCGTSKLTPCNCAGYALERAMNRKNRQQLADIAIFAIREMRKKTVDIRPVQW
jgi:hypothetical protein